MVTKSLLTGTMLFVLGVTSAVAQLALARFEGAPTKAADGLLVDLTVDIPVYEARCDSGAAQASQPLDTSMAGLELIGCGATPAKTIRAGFDFVVAAGGQQSRLVVPFGVKTARRSGKPRLTLSLALSAKGGQGPLAVEVNGKLVQDGVRRTASGSPAPLELTGFVNEGRNVLTLVVVGGEPDVGPRLGSVELRSLDSATTVHGYSAAERRAAATFRTAGRTFDAIPLETRDGLRYYSATEQLPVAERGGEASLGLLGRSR